MGFSNFDKVSAENGFFVGPYGAEVKLLGPENKVRRIVKVPLSAADTGGGVLAWANPEATLIIVTRLLVNVTTKSTGACTLDFGTTGTSATTSSDNLLDGIDVATAGLFDNASAVSLLLASGKWITGSKATGTAAGLKGDAYIEYIEA